MLFINCRRALEKFDKKHKTEKNIVSIIFSHLAPRKELEERTSL